MKKYLLLCLVLLLLLTGCGGEAAQETTDVTLDRLETQVTLPEPRGEPPMVVRFRGEDREGKETGGDTVVLHFSYSVPRVEIPGNISASDSINGVFEALKTDFLEGTDESLLGGYEEILADARIFREDLGENFLPYWLSMDPEVLRGDDQVLSIAVTWDSFLGGAHGSRTVRGFVFDRETGRQLDLKDLAKDPERFPDFLRDFMVNTMNTDPMIREQLDFYQPQEYPDLLMGLLRRGNWYLNDGGLVIFSDEYELGSYAAGTVEFTVPYYVLKGILREEYLPEVTGKGSFVLHPPVGCNAWIVDDVSVDPQGTILMLEARGKVSNVALRKVEFLDYYIPRDMVWYCDSMENNVVRLEAYIPDAAPNLMLSYETEEGYFNYLLAQSGEDGSFFLMDPAGDLPVG